MSSEIITAWGEKCNKYYKKTIYWHLHMHYYLQIGDSCFKVAYIVSMRTQTVCKKALKPWWGLKPLYFFKHRHRYIFKKLPQPIKSKYTNDAASVITITSLHPLYWFSQKDNKPNTNIKPKTTQNKTKTFQTHSGWFLSNLFRLAYPVLCAHHGHTHSWGTSTWLPE